jgi:hypothetical protein
LVLGLPLGVQADDAVDLGLPIVGEAAADAQRGKVASDTPEKN